MQVSDQIHSPVGLVPYTLDRALDWNQNQFGISSDEKNTIPCQELYLDLSL